MGKRWRKLGFIAIFICGFFIVGIILGNIFTDILRELPEDTGFMRNNFWGFIILLFSFFVFLFISAFLQVIVHETGHLVCGLLSAYRFVSFRIGTYTLIKRGGKYRIKKYNVPGTAGQCLMMPPEQKNDKIPYKLYNAGGVLFNFAFSAVAILCIMLFQLPVFVHILLLAFSIAGIFYGLLNFIPMRMSGIANDGYNMRMLGKDAVARFIFYTQLKINGLQMQGMRLSDMPDDWFRIPKDTDMNNGFHLSMFLLRSARYTEQLKFSEAHDCLDKVEPFSLKLVELYQIEMLCELLFLEMVGAGRQEIIRLLYTDKVRKYMENYQDVIFSKKRILYTIALLLEDDEEQAARLFDEAVKLEDTYPNLGESKGELHIMEYVRDTFSRRAS